MWPSSIEFTPRQLCDEYARNYDSPAFKGMMRALVFACAGPDLTSSGPATPVPEEAEPVCHAPKPVEQPSLPVDTANTVEVPVGTTETPQNEG